MDNEIPYSLPLTAAFGDAVDTLRARLTAASASGELPHSCSYSTSSLELDFADITADDSLLGTSRSIEGTDWDALLGGEGWMLFMTVMDGRVSIRSQASTPDSAKAVVETYRELLHEPVKQPSPDRTTVEFCHASSRGVQRSRRDVSCPSWEEIQPNYQADVRGVFDRLMATNEPVSGRLILMWGPPGTGKTTAVRALAREWSSWCKTSYVLDPEMLFGSSEYFNNLALDADSNRSLFEDLDDDMPAPAQSQSWRLLVIEDADSVISSDARAQSGQALSRLLNLTDGIVGQGLRTLVLITTNEPLSALHPALTRPGRCLAQLHVGPLSRAEATAWLSAAGRSDLAGKVHADGATVADLYALMADVEPLELEKPSAHTPAGYI